MEALHREAELGHGDVLRQLLSIGADVAATDSIGRTALHCASLKGREESVRVLLEAAEEQGRLDAVLLARDNSGRTPLDVCNGRCAALIERYARKALHRAATYGHVDALRQLLSAGADVAASDSDGWTALHCASVTGREECVRVLMEAAKEEGRLDAVLNAEDNRGYSALDCSANASCFSLLLQCGDSGWEALHRAAQIGKADILRQLLSAGADVAATDSWGRTALHCASLNGRAECVQILLKTAEEQGCLDAVLSGMDNHGKTPLDVCDRSCFSLLLQRGGRGREALHRAAEYGQVDVLRQLLSAVADVAATDSCGMTALHCASFYGRAECVRVILEAAQIKGCLDAVVNAVNSNGETPLDLCDRSCFSLLLQCGGRGRALHRAVQHGEVALRQLLSAGADLAALNSGGNTALHLASLYGREECVRVLLEAAEKQGCLDAVLNAVNENGMTPLDMCDYGDSCFLLLLQRGGRDREALHRPAVKGDVDTLRQLLGNGTDLAASDYHGRNALYSACKAGKKECVRVLLEAAEEQGRLDAVLNAPDKDGKTPLDVCDDPISFSLVLQSGGRGREALHRAAENGDVDTLRQLVGNGTELAASDYHGRNALYFACKAREEECVRILLEAAEEQGRLDVVLNAADKDGKTPLDVCDDPISFSLVLQRGGRGREALHRAAELGQVDALRQLLSAGADVAASDSSSYTALHWASKEGELQCVRVLLEAAEEQGRLDAVLNAADNNGNTPLDVCDDRCFSLLQQRGAHAGERIPGTMRPGVITQLLGMKLNQHLSLA